MNFLALKSIIGGGGAFALCMAKNPVTVPKSVVEDLVELKK